MQLIYHPEAEDELIEAARFYEGRSATLGERFLQAVDRAIAIIQEAPVSWMIVEDDVRKYSLSGFPYSIYYRELPEGIRVLAVKHHRRHQNYWRHRLAD